MTCACSERLSWAEVAPNRITQPRAGVPVVGPDLQEAGGEESRPRRRGIGWKADDRRVTRQGESGEDLGRAGLRRQQWCWMGTEKSTEALVAGWAQPGRAEQPLDSGRQTGRLGRRGAAGMHDGSALVVRGGGRGAHLGRRLRGRKQICAQWGAVSVVGTGGESSLGDGHPHGEVL